MIDVPFVTERLSIRRFKPKDLNAFLEFMLDKASTGYLMFEDDQKTERGARELFNFVIDSYDSPEPVYSFVIAAKDSDEYLGSCGFSPYAEGIVEVYYSVNRSHWGKGIASEATRALTEKLSDHSEVRAYCHPKNHAAHSVAKKVGFEPKGIQKHEHFAVEGELFVYRQGSE